MQASLWTYRILNYRNAMTILYCAMVLGWQLDFKNTRKGILMTYKLRMYISVCLSNLIK